MSSSSQQFDFEYKFMSLILFLVLIVLPSASSAYSYLYNGSSGHFVVAGFSTSLLVSVYWSAGLNKNFDEKPYNIYVLHMLGILLSFVAVVNFIAAFL